MSGKRFNPLDDPPTASSGEEEEAETSTGEGEEVDGSSSSEEEDNEPSSAVKKPATTLPAADKSQVSGSESGSDSETDSGSDTERKDPVKNKGSTVAKSAAVTKDSAVVKKHQDSKKVETSAKSASKKRSIETEGAAASTDAKRVKRVSGEDEKKSGGGGGGGEETKKTYFQRVWSEEDEIALLQGIIDYKTDTGVSPYDDKDEFYQLVKKSISFDVSKVQVMEKLRSLKKKFENNIGKGKKNGEEPAFTKSHDQEAFGLSKSIWGANGILFESAVKSNGKSKNKSSKSKKVESVKPELISSLQNVKSCEDEETDTGEVELDSGIVKLLARFGMDDLAAQQGWTRLAAEDKNRFEEQWKVLQIKEFEFYSQRSGFIHEVVTKMAEAFRPNP